MYILAVSADHHFEVARFADEIEVMVVKRSMLASMRNVTVFFSLGCSRIFKSFQLFQGTCHAPDKVAYIELDHLLPFIFPGICHFDRCRYFAVFSHFRFVESQFPYRNSV